MKNELYIQLEKLRSDSLAISDSSNSMQLELEMYKNELINIQPYAISVCIILLAVIIISVLFLKKKKRKQLELNQTYEKNLEERIKSYNTLTTHMFQLSHTIRGKICTFYAATQLLKFNMVNDEVKDSLTENFKELRELSERL